MLRPLSSFPEHPTRSGVSQLGGSRVRDTGSTYDEFSEADCWAQENRGPPRLRFRKRYYYNRELLEQWVKAQCAAELTAAATLIKWSR
jgi:hypothetical protein